MDPAAGNISGWYSNADTSSSAEDILQATFAHAKVLLRSILKAQDYSTLFPTSPGTHQATATAHTIFDVQRCLRNAQFSYECRTGQAPDNFQDIAPSTSSGVSSLTTPLSKKRAKARLWLTNVSEKLVHYGNVFDVLVQHHPEYVSLAWGTFKFLFVAITNHAETASKLSKSISRIADLLPQHSLHLILYPTPQMQLSVARLYTHILNFFLSSLKWYEDNRAVHAIKAIFQPWELRFKNEFEAIAAESQQIRQLADVAMKAEVRDTRLEVVQGNVQGSRHWELVREEMRELRGENARLASLLQSKFGSIESSMVCMYTTLRLDLSTQRSTLARIHLTQLLSLPLFASLPTSGESLAFCRSMRARTRQRPSLSLPGVSKLQIWASQRTNSILLIDTYLPLLAKTFMVDLINLILSNSLPILWALRYADYWDARLSAVDVVRMLVLQVMQVGAGEHLLDGPFPVTVEQLREAGSVKEWVAILDQLLSRVKHAFVVLDTDLLAQATSHERGAALEMLDVLRRGLKGNVKIVTAMGSVSQTYVEELGEEGACVKIQTGGGGDWRRLQRSKKAGRGRELFRSQ